MRKSSIHIKPVLNTSENHNTRKVVPSYVIETDFKNESIIFDTIETRKSKIEQIAKNVGGRKLQTNAEPIKEAVLVLEEHHTMEDLQLVANELHRRFMIETIQIHIHRDEGKDKDNINWHAHMVLDWQNKATGKLIRLNPKDMMEMQTIVANSLKMERGMVNSKSERLEHREYKEALEEKKKYLLKELEPLEQTLKDLKEKYQTQKNFLHLLKVERETSKTNTETLQKEIDRINELAAEQKIKRRFRF